MIRRRTVEIDCIVEIEQTPEFLAAHAIPEGIDIRPGDVVTVHGAPTSVPFGGHVRVPARATVRRGNIFDRLRAHVGGFFALTELYEVGFAPKEAAWPTA